MRTGVLASAIHGCHARTLLAARVLLHRVVDETGERELVVALKDVVVQTVVQSDLAGRLHVLGAVQRQVRRLVGDNSPEKSSCNRYMYEADYVNMES